LYRLGSSTVKTEFSKLNYRLINKSGFPEIARERDETRLGRGGVPPPQGEGYSLRLPVPKGGGGPPPWGEGWSAGVMVKFCQLIVSI
jgi:hypothetical protein